MFTTKLAQALLQKRFPYGYYFQIMLPGAMVGLIVGYATQKYGAASQVQRAEA